MAKRLTASLFLIAAILAIGCESPVDDGLGGPQFRQQSINYTAPAPRGSTLPPVAPTYQPVQRQQTVVRPPVNYRAALASDIPADWIPHVKANDWQWIVIHHTATTFGNAAIVTRWHIDRGFDEMGYHFLIGNGSNSGDGQIEVGTRWPKQKWGAHTKTPDNRFNDYGIGICLVGNFDVGYPTPAQMRSLDKLVAYLMKTYHIPPDHVLGHNDCKSTDCPGKHLNVAVVRRGALAILAAAGTPIPQSPRLAAAGQELMRDAK